MHVKKSIKFNILDKYKFKETELKILVSSVSVLFLNMKYDLKFMLIVLTRVYYILFN